jgi:hypothetical protein
MIALQRTARVIGAVLVEMATVFALVAIGHRPGLTVPISHLGPWLRDGDPATVVVALLRWVALVGASWLLVSTLLYLAAAMSRVPAVVRAVRWSTLPAVRRAVDAACAMSVATSVVLVPAAAGATGVAGRARASDPPSVSLVRNGRGIAELPPDTTVPGRRPEDLEVPVSAPPPTTLAVTPVSTPSRGAPVAPVVPVAPSNSEVVVVVEGDNLWTIAAARLARASGRAPGDVPAAEIAPYWERVCNANRARLASGDPDLVFPGEPVLLPALS